MTNFNKEYKKLYKNYNKKLKQLHKESFATSDTPIYYFITYLQFLRDQHLLISPFTEKLGEDNVNLASIVAALSEFQKYESCIHKYYQIEGNTLTRRPEYSEEEAKTKYMEEQSKHWEAFWNIVKLCIEGWGLNAQL